MLTEVKVLTSKTTEGYDCLERECTLRIVQWYNMVFFHHIDHAVLAGKSCLRLDWLWKVLRVLKLRTLQITRKAPLSVLPKDSIYYS